jgi:hypothetical protein
MTRRPFDFTNLNANLNAVQVYFFGSFPRPGPMRVRRLANAH